MQETLTDNKEAAPPPEKETLAQAEPETPFDDAVKESPKTKGILSQVTTKRKRRPLFFILMGPPGVGKTTFASQAPNPIFIQTERGTDQLNVARLPLVETLSDYKVQIQALVNEPHDYKTIVIDSLDGLESVIWAEVCQINSWKSIEDPGWGKGFTHAREVWAKIIKRLMSLSEKHNIVMIAHAMVKTINDPALSTPFDQWMMRIHEKSAILLKQQVDLMLFANLARTIDKPNPQAKKGRAIVSDDRELWTSPTAGIEAKNRFNLPNPMIFSWAALREEINKFYSK